MRRALARMAAQAVSSPGLRGFARAGASMQRRLRGARPLVRYFHDPADPYSHLTAQLLPKLMATYEVVFAVHLVSPPDAGAAPEAERLAAFARRDAALLAEAHGLRMPSGAPTVGEVAAAAAELAQHPEPEAFGENAPRIGEALWSGQLPPLPMPNPALFQPGDSLRRKLGHYLGATFYFEGEWYWGPDRLPYLEDRMAFARRSGVSVCRFIDESAEPGSASGATLDFFLSFRSPYTYLAAERISALAKRHGAQLRLRYVMPMVMRGLPVPPAKRLYIVRDTKREAERRGLAFGDICDPVGVGVERGLAVLEQAIALGQGEAFAQALLRGVFAEGIDAASDAGLSRICRNAGVAESIIPSALADTRWRAVAEANRAEMFALGLWGVPSFRVVNHQAHWGQDRLWAVEQDLRAETAVRQNRESVA